jgi:hypothetical protein
MTPRFTIDFRREAMRRNAARARRRALMLALWLSYFGALGLIVSSYGLNWLTLVNRAGQLERRTATMRALRERGRTWEAGADDIAELERYADDPRRWRDRLVRLAELLPPDARITSVALDPTAPANPGDHALVVTGEVRRLPGRDHLRQVMDLIAAMRADSTITNDYPNVRLVSTRVTPTSGASTEFVIECR